MLRSNYILILLTLCVHLHSQTPGYLGKRTVVGYGVEFSPMIYGANYYNKTVVGRGGSAEEIQLWFNSTHHGFYEYNFSKNLMIGAAAKYCRTGYDNQATVMGPVSKKPVGSYRINAAEFQLYFKQYYKSYVAPWGKYIMVGPVATAIFTKHTPYMYVRHTVNEHDTLITDFGKNYQTHFIADVMLGFGRSRIIKEKIVIDFGFNTQVIALFKTSETTDPEEIDFRTQSEYIAETAKSRMRGVNRFNFFLKLGYLF